MSKERRGQGRRRHRSLLLSLEMGLDWTAPDDPDSLSDLLSVALPTFDLSSVLLLQLLTTTCSDLLSSRVSMSNIIQAYLISPILNQARKISGLEETEAELKEPSIDPNLVSYIDAAPGASVNMHDEEIRAKLLTGDDFFRPSSNVILGKAPVSSYTRSWRP